MKRTAPIASILLALAGLTGVGHSAPKSPTPPPDALWQPYRITPRTGAQHVALEGPWQLGWRDTPVADAVAGGGIVP